MGMEYVATKHGTLPKLGLGTFSITEERLRLLVPEALSLGYSLFDTAYKYHNEDILGNIFSISGRNRSEYIIETKLHPELLLGNKRFLRLNGISPQRALKNACKRLCVNNIDILMLHSPFSGYENRLKDLRLLKQEGVINLVGLCNVNLNQLSNLERQNLLPDIVQVEIHPYHTNKLLIEFCQLHDIVVESRSPFAHGDALIEWNEEPVLQAIAKKYQATIPQIILRWITSQNIIALPRTSTIAHLKENLDSFCIKLFPNEMKMIDALNQDKSYGFIPSRRKEV